MVLDARRFGARHPKPYMAATAAKHLRVAVVGVRLPLWAREVNMFPLTEDQEKELDEMAKRFERTKGGK